MADGAICDIEVEIEAFSDEEIIYGVDAELVLLIPVFALALGVVFEGDCTESASV
jgi:hypothetical protein